MMSSSYLGYVSLVCMLSWLSVSTSLSYYVTAPGGSPCPANTTCHNLSYYTSEPSAYFTSNTIFYILEGTHFLEQEELVVISNVTNLTLQALGNITQGPHETVQQSTVIISCLGTRGGLAIFNSSNVTLSSITVLSCANNIPGEQFAGYGQVSIGIVHSFNAVLDHVSVQNSSAFGLITVNSFNARIQDSSFYSNKYQLTDLDECSLLQILNCPGGNAFIMFSDVYLEDDDLTQNFTFDVINSNFSFGFNLFYGVGSGLKIEFTNTLTYKVSILIDNVVLYANKAVLGANLDISFANSLSYYDIIVNNTASLNGNDQPVLNSEAYGFFLPSQGAGLSFQHSSDTSLEASFSVYNSNFSHNRATRGGAISVTWISNDIGEIKFESCNFFNNTGNDTSAVYLAFIIDFTFSKLIPAYTFKNVTINSNQPEMTFNSTLQSTIKIEGLPRVVFEDVIVSNNPITGLAAFTTTLIFTGTGNHFFNNSGINGGAIAIYGGSFLVLQEPAILRITDNHATNEGGGLYVNQPVSPNNVMCFFQEIILNNFAPSGPTVVIMEGNTAGVSGSALYGGNEIDSCSSLASYDTFFQITDQPGQSVVSSDPTGVCFCDQYGETDCETTQYTTNTVPGKSFSFVVTAVGNLNGLTSGVIGVYNRYANPSLTQQTVQGKCKKFEFPLTVSNASLSSIDVTISLDSIETARLTPPPTISLLVNILPCPIGFQLSVNTGTCDCTSELLLANLNLTCDISSGEIIRYGHVWVGYDSMRNCTLVNSFCPLGYCNGDLVNFTLQDPTPQCALNRTGLLCGGCAQNLSLLLGSNRCGECSNSYLSLIIPFILAGIILVVFLIALNLTVSVGAINGLIFYANIIKIAESIFFPAPIPFLNQFISWINLDLGIETCFYDGMTACQKVWLQFVFPAYLWLIITTIIIFARYSQRLVQVVGTHIVNVLATLLLLSYTKLIRTVILALYLMQITCNEEPVTVWFVDGNVPYISGCHAPLFIVSLLVLLVFILPYTLFILVGPLLESHATKYKLFHWVVRLKPILDAYGGPYKDRFRFWTGFLLFIRLCLALIISLSSSIAVSLTSLMCFTVVIVTIHTIAAGVYTKTYLNAIEITFLLNLLFLGYFVSQETSVDAEASSIAQVGIIILLAISFIVFLGIISHHIYLRFQLRLDGLLFKSSKLSHRKRSNGSAEMLDGEVVLVPSHTHSEVGIFERRRETMLLDYQQFTDEDHDQ